MKIEELKIQGYRSLYDVTWKPGDLNVLIGPNASGKTNFLNFLKFLSLSAEGKLGDFIRKEGGFKAISWDEDGRNIMTKLKIISARRKTEPMSCYLLYIMGVKNKFFVLEEYLGKVFRGKSALSISDKLTKDFVFSRRFRDSTIINEKTNRKIDLVVDTPDESLLSSGTGPFTPNKKINEFMKYFSSWSVYHTFSTDQNAQIRMPSVSRYEYQVASDGQNLISVLHTLYTTDREFKKELNNAMKVAFGDDFDELVFPPDADQRVQLRLRWKSLKKERSAADLSDGTLRFLLLMAVLANPKPAPLIAIDEPEIGLHPSMLPIIAEFAVEASRKTQVIFATHSPEFLGAFRDTIPTTTVAKLNEGKTELKTINGEDLSKWLKEYTLGELMKTGELEAMG